MDAAVSGSLANCGKEVIRVFWKKEKTNRKHTLDIGDVEGRTESRRGLREQGLAGRGNSWLEREVDRSTGFSFFLVPLLLVDGSGERNEGNRERGREKDERETGRE